MSDSRTPLARARGLGSAHSGVRPWWVQRVSAVLLIPLSLWLVISLLRLAGAPYATARDWLAAPGNGIAMLLLLGASFLHLYLGLQVIIEDYVDDRRLAMALRLLATASCLVLPLIGAFAVLHVAFGG